MLTKALAAMAVVAVVATASTASATIFDITFTGTVAADGQDPLSGLDVGNFFGGGNLAGDAFAATFLLDTTKGIPVTGDIPPFGIESGWVGGAEFGTISMFDIVALSINNHTVSFATNIRDVQYYGEGGSTFFDSDSMGQVAQLYNSYISVEAFVNSPYPLRTFRSSATNIEGIYDIYNYIDNDASYDYGDLVTTSISMTSLPEPTSWALMILGFGGIGAAMRRHKFA